MQSTAVTTSVLRCCYIVSHRMYAGTCSNMSRAGSLEAKMRTSLLMVSPAKAAVARARMVASFILSN